MASAPRSASNPASPRISSSSPASDDAMQRAEFVARRIAQISEIELAETAFAHARRVFDRGAASGDAGVVPCVRLLGSVHRKADGAAVADRRRFAIARRADEEQPAVVHIDQASLVVDDRSEEHTSALQSL